MSAIERSMMMVESGSSSGSVASPNVPPAAPDAIARYLCSNCEPPAGFCRMVSRATLSAAWSPLAVAAAIAWDALSGSALPISSIGRPTRLASRAASPGCSSEATARRSAAMSASIMDIG